MSYQLNEKVQIIKDQLEILWDVFKAQQEKSLMIQLISRVSKRQQTGNCQ